MIVVAAIIARDGRVLVCQRDRSGKFPLKWEFPGGKVLPNETPQEALERELHEELGMAADIGAEVLRTQHKYAEMSELVELIFFRAQVEGRDIQNRIFHQLKWMEPEKLNELDFLEADRGLVWKIMSGAIRI